MFLRKTTMLFLTFLLSAVLLVVYSLYAPSLSKADELREWIGKYKLYEIAPPPNTRMRRRHIINIYKEDGGYFAKIKLDGFMTFFRMKARVVGDKETITLIFLEDILEGGRNPYRRYKEGDVLLRFQKIGWNIYTYWGKITPMLLANLESGRVYYERAYPFRHSGLVQSLE